MRSPLELARSGYVGFEAGVYCCTTCGALVVDQAAHSDWHLSVAEWLRALRDEKADYIP